MVNAVNYWFCTNELLCCTLFILLFQLDLCPVVAKVQLLPSVVS